MEHPNSEVVRQVGDLTAVGVVVGTLAGWLPHIAAFFTILWTALRVYEIITGQPFSQSRVAQYVSKFLKRL